MRFDNVNFGTITVPSYGDKVKTVVIGNRDITLDELAAALVKLDDESMRMLSQQTQTRRFRNAVFARLVTLEESARGYARMSENCADNVADEIQQARVDLERLP